MPDVLSVLVGAWVFTVGASVGSFLNVVIARVPAGESIVRPRSRCPRCRTSIRARDNVPVLSWVLLRGRCRTCRAPISVRYPLVELLGAAAALTAWARHGLGLAAALELAFVALLLALAAIDLDCWELPYELTRPLIVLGLAASALAASGAPTARSSALGAALGFGAFWLVMKGGQLLARKEAMGVGDVWLLAGLGAWLGVEALLPVVMLASIQGSVVGIALMLTGRGQKGPEGEGREATSSSTASTSTDEVKVEVKVQDQVQVQDHDKGKGKDEVGEEAWVPPRNAVPFGPFLALGALEWMYAGDLLARLIAPLQVFR